MTMTITRPPFRTSRLARVATTLLAAGALTAGSILVTATPAAAASAVSGCAYIDPTHISLAVDAPGLLGGLANIGTVTFTDAQGNLLGTSTTARLLNGLIHIDVPSLAVPAGLPAINYSIALIPLLGGVLAPIVGNTPCAALPIQAVTGSYEVLRPTRILDTRTGLGGSKIPAHGSITLAVANHAGVPPLAGLLGLPGSGPSTVNINFTATNAAANGVITVYPSGTGRPLASNLNFTAGHDVANTTIAKLGANGAITIYNGSTSPVDLVGDVSGYYITGLLTSVLPLLPGAYQPLNTQVRLLDTRTSGGKVAFNQSRAVTVTGSDGVPASAASVVLNVTSTNATANGHIRAYPTGSPLPFASNLNFKTGQTVANEVVVAPNANGQVSLFNGGPGSTTDLVVDVVGYIAGGLLPVQTPGLQNAVTPKRLLDTRYAIGTPTAGKVPAGGVKIVKVAGLDGVPSNYARAAVITVTATNETALGFATVYPGGTRPNASILNFLSGPGRGGVNDVATVMIAPIAANGTITIYNGSTGPTDLVIDISAYITGTTVSLG